MKRFLLLGGFLLLAPLALAADDFWSRLTPAERAAAGLGQLTEQQRTALDALVGRYARAGAGREIETVRAVARAEGEAVAKAAIEREIRQREESRAGLKNAPSSGSEVVRSRLADRFSGWSGKTVFRLENGQTWVQSDVTESYWVPVQDGPEIELRKTGLGGWRLYVMPDGHWVRVKRVR